MLHDMASSSDTTSGLISATTTQTLLSDRRCVSCGYNLRGIAVAALCPECSRPVADSLRGELLQYADAAFIQKLLKGCNLIIWSWWAILIAGLAASVLGFAIPSIASQANATADVVYAALSLTILLGYFLLTEPDPQLESEESPKSARRIVRSAAILSFVLELSSTALGVALSGNAMGGPMLSSALLVLDCVWTVGLIIQFFAMLSYLRWFANRVPDRHMQRLAKRYRWLLPVLSFTIILPLLMYLMLLARLRTHLRAIKLTGHPADLVGV